MPRSGRFPLPVYEDAIQRISSLKYDLVILDVKGVRGFDPRRWALSGDAGGRGDGTRVEHGIVGKSKDLEARALLPKDQPGHMAPFLENVPTLSFRITQNPTFAKLGDSSRMRFGRD